MIEVMIAILLTALTVIGVLGLYKIESRASSFSRRETEAAVLAQDKLEALRTQAAPGGGSTGSENVTDPLTNNATFWTRSWTIAASLTDPAVFNITVDVTWDDNGQQRTVTVRGQRGSS